MRIEPLTSDSPYLDAAAAMLTTTFSREYMFVAIAGDSPNKDEIARLRYRHILLHGVLDLEASVAVDESKDSKEDDSVLGIMIVKKPDIDISKTPHAESELKRASAALCTPEILVGAGELEAIEEGIESVTWGPTGLNDMYFLHFLCTSDAARGKGVAHALLSPLLEMVGGDGVEIGLITHTEQNVKYYERYGFRVREMLDSTLRGTPAHYWSMSKP